MVTLSIIVNYYNKMKYIDDCMNSIVEIPDTEIIIVDDGSIDTQSKYLEKFRVYDNVKIITNRSNKSLGMSRVIGMNAASGKYVKFIDADDYMIRADFIDFIKEHLYSETPRIIYHEFEEIDKWGDSCTIDNEYLHSFKEGTKTIRDLVDSPVLTKCTHSMVDKIWPREIYYPVATRLIKEDFYINWMEDMLLFQFFLFYAMQYNKGKTPFVYSPNPPIYVYQWENEDNLTNAEGIKDDTAKFLALYNEMMEAHSPVFKKAYNLVLMNHEINSLNKERGFDFRL